MPALSETLVTLLQHHEIASGGELVRIIVNMQQSILKAQFLPTGNLEISQFRPISEISRGQKLHEPSSHQEGSAWLAAGNLSRSSPDLKPDLSLALQNSGSLPRQPEPLQVSSS